MTIKPTNKKDNAGYKRGICTAYGTDEQPINSWFCDSFQIIGAVQCDFETDKGIKIWSFSGKELQVDSGYTTRITCEK